MRLWILLLLILVLIVYIFLLRNVAWIVRTIRKIASYGNIGGYTKLVQLWFVLLLTALFAGIVLYYILVPEKVSRIDVILTVVVGWLGLIIGRFFGEEAMQKLDIKKEENIKEVISTIKKYQEIRPRIIELRKNK